MGRLILLICLVYWFVSSSDSFKVVVNDVNGVAKELRQKLDKLKSEIDKRNKPEVADTLSNDGVEDIKVAPVKTGDKYSW